MSLQGSKRKSINILTLTWNGVDKLKRLTPGLQESIWKWCAQEEHDTFKYYKWSIRDNGSTDGTMDWLRSEEGPTNWGCDPVGHNRANFAQGVNSLYEWYEENPDEKEERFFLLLNNDVEFADDQSIIKMMNLMESDPKIGVVGARLLYNGTNKLQHAGVIFGPKYGYMPYHYRHQEESDKDAEKNRYFQAVTAACCLVRESAMRKLDEGFSWAFEDIDLCLRIGQDGWKVAYCGGTNIYHEESASLKKNPVNKLFLKSNVKRFKEKWFGNYKLDHKRYLANKNYNLIKDGS